MAAEVLCTCAHVSNARQGGGHVFARLTAVHDDVRAPLEWVLEGRGAERGIDEQPTSSLVHLVCIVFNVPAKA